MRVPPSTWLFSKRWRVGGLTIAYLDVSLGLISDLHDKFSLGVDHVLKNLLINATDQDLSNLNLLNDHETTYTAPRLSELDTKRYSFPSAIN